MRRVRQHTFHAGCCIEDTFSCKLSTPSGTHNNISSRKRDFLYVFREDHNFGNSSSDTNVAASTRIFRRRAEVNLFLLKVSKISRTESVKFVGCLLSIFRSLKLLDKNSKYSYLVMNSFKSIPTNSERKSKKNSFLINLK